MEQGTFLRGAILLLNTVLSVAAKDATCRFPAELYGTKYPWSIMSADYSSRFPHSHRKVRFDGKNMVMYFIPTEREARTAVYTCEDSYNDEKYMVSLHESGWNTRYTCLKFIIRSRNVVQLKLADPGYVRSPALCGDVYMHLMEAPLVYFYAGGDWARERLPINSYQPCPLEGGYVLREWFDEADKAAFEADTLLPPVKLENECEKGEGLRFVCDRNKVRCPLPHPALHQRNNYCLGSWMDGTYTYMVLYNLEDDRLVPCMRYPNQRDEKFTAHLFFDGICATGNPPRTSRSFRRISLRREVEEYCGDRTRSCSGVDRMKCARGMDKYCRYTCGVCDNPSAVWKSLRIYPEFRGTWVKDTMSQGYENVVFGLEHATFPSLGKYRLYEKYWYQSADEQEDGRAYAPARLQKEYLMLATYDNGCSPRVGLLNVVKRSDSVLSVRLSQPELVEHFGQTQKALEDMDNTLSFSHSPPANVYEMYRNRPGNWFNLVRRDERPAMVRCHLPYAYFRILLDDGRLCDGSLAAVDDYNFEMVFRACNGSAEGGEAPPPTQFECLAAFDGEFGKSYLITRMLGGLRELVRQRYLCWAFSSTDEGALYWMRVSDCDVSTEDYVEHGARFPIAKLQVATLSPEDEPSTYSRWLVFLMVLFVWLFG